MVQHSSDHHSKYLFMLVQVIVSYICLNTAFVKSGCAMSTLLFHTTTSFISYIQFLEKNGFNNYVQNYLVLSKNHNVHFRIGFHSEVCRMFCKCFLKCTWILTNSFHIYIYIYIYISFSFFFFLSFFLF
jgi:hypothetical protein